MLRYFPGIVLVQLVTLALFWVNRSGSLEEIVLRAGLPAIFIACITALWLSTLGRMESEKRHGKLREAHFAERERLNREIERVRSDALEQASADKAQIMERAHAEREKLVRQTHKEIIKQERRVGRRANMKVGLAFMGMTGLGVIMLITELLTLGLLTITTAGGAMGGYLLRWRQTRRVMDLVSQGPKEVDFVDAEIIPVSDVANDAPDSAPQAQLSNDGLAAGKKDKSKRKSGSSKSVL